MQSLVILGHHDGQIAWTHFGRVGGKGLSQEPNPETTNLRLTTWTLIYWVARPLAEISAFSVFPKNTTVHYAQCGHWTSILTITIQHSWTDWATPPQVGMNTHLWGCMNCSPREEHSRFLKVLPLLSVKRLAFTYKIFMIRQKTYWTIASIVNSQKVWPLFAVISL